jgi:hypothetical protein
LEVRIAICSEIVETFFLLETFTFKLGAAVIVLAAVGVVSL